jgi:hypothetical protein
MPCCSSVVTLKKSRLGTQFFAHKALGTCLIAAETEAHLRIKRMAIEAARANGWTANAEVPGISPSGEPWKADVLAHKDGRKVAVEVQWSRQAVEEIWRRHVRYKESGVRCLWLLRQPDFPVTRRLPAVCIGGSLEQGFSALVPGHSRMRVRDRSQPDRWHQSLSIAALLDAAFSKRLQFGIPADADATVSVQATPTSCWYRHCRAKMRIVTSITVVFGQTECSFSISELGEHPALLQTVLDKLPKNLSIGMIKPRFSQTQERFYMSNGCPRCDRIFGEFFEIHIRYDEETLLRFPIRLSKQWRRAIEGHYSYEGTWSAYPPTNRTI